MSTKNAFAGRYLTKSRYKLALECPTKLFYTSKKDTYYDSKIDNDFLKALAEGGFQVGELAKLYYPNGTDIDELDYEISLKKTRELLKNENAIIYEAAFQYELLFIRADIIVKIGNKINLIEVKAKSFDPTADSFTSSRTGEVTAKWKPYIYDAAFQKYVISKSNPEYEVSAHLLLADKSSTANIEGLNQMFLIYKQNGRYKTKFKHAGEGVGLGNKILVEVNVDECLNNIFASPEFEESIKNYSNSYNIDKKIEPVIGSVCGKCEFKCSDTQISEGYKSGFNECWNQVGVSDEQLRKPLILSLWDFRKKDEYIKQKKYFLSDLNREDLEPKTKRKADSINWLSRIDRQELQLNYSKEPDKLPFLDIPGLKAEFKKWQFPLHFIDFETTSVAIPFNSGRHPYEQIAFQYSHHQMTQDGVITHEGQWISEIQGKFPNYDFVRALKKELENDQGTIFRFAAHENSILNAIYRQLIKSEEKDKRELCNWIKTITKSSSSSVEEWEGERNMVDLREMALRYYFDPSTNGSNSIKQILPAVLESSDYLKSKYSKPAYGKDIKSLNFKNQTWINFDENKKIINPYYLLPPIHDEASNEMLDEFLIDEETGIADGGGAMIAFAKMQFTEMTEIERKKITDALLRYCELDTLAMVMIYEAWNEWCK